MEHAVDFNSHLALDRFLECVGKSGLVAESVMEKMRSPSYRAEEEIRTTSDCAHHLWVNGSVTGWQLHSLLQSRYKGFFLGDYKLLDRLDDRSSVAARRFQLEAAIAEVRADNLADELRDAMLRELEACVRALG